MMPRCVVIPQWDSHLLCTITSARCVATHPYTPVNGSPVLTRFSPLLPNRQSKTAGSDRTLRFFYALRHV